MSFLNNEFNIDRLNVFSSIYYSCRTIKRIEIFESIFICRHDQKLLF